MNTWPDRAEPGELRDQLLKKLDIYEYPRTNNNHLRYSNIELQTLIQLFGFLGAKQKEKFAPAK
jgi:hypothetical protein